MDSCLTCASAPFTAGFTIFGTNEPADAATFRFKRCERFNARLEKSNSRVRSWAQFYTFTNEIRNAPRNIRETTVEFSPRIACANSIVLPINRFQRLLPRNPNFLPNVSCRNFLKLKCNITFTRCKLTTSALFRRTTQSFSKIIFRGNCL